MDTKRSANARGKAKVHDLESVVDALNAHKRADGEANRLLPRALRPGMLAAGRDGIPIPIKTGGELREWPQMKGR